MAAAPAQGAAAAAPVVVPPAPVFTFNIVHRAGGAPAQRGSWISGPPDHSFMLGFADLDEAPPDVEESYVPYYVAEAFLLTFTCVASIPARIVVGEYQLTIAKAREIIEHLITDMEFDFGAGSTETLALALKSAYVTHGDEALKLAADDFENVPEPVTVNATGLTNSLCRGLSFYGLLSHNLPGRGDMQMLLIMLGQRGFVTKRAARMQETHDLLDIALRETLASENGTVARSSYNGLSGADLASELFAWLRQTALPRHFPTVPAVTRLTMLQSYQFRDNVYRNRHEESLVQRVDWKSGLTPSFDAFLSGCSPSPHPGEVVQTFFHLSEAFMDGKTVNRRMSSSFLSLFDREITYYSHSLPDAGTIADRAAALIICRDDEQANLKQLSKGSGVSAAPGSGTTKALITSGVAADMTKAIKTAGFLAMHEATQPYAAPPARNPFAFFAHMFKAVRKGTLVPLQVLATSHVTYGSLHPFFVNLHDLTPYLGTYVGGLLSVDNHGQHLQQMIGYEPPPKLVDKLVKGDLDGLVLFALKEGLLHKKAFAMKAVGTSLYKPIKDLPALDIATLDELDLDPTGVATRAS